MESSSFIKGLTVCEKEVFCVGRVETQEGVIDMKIRTTIFFLIAISSVLLAAQITTDKFKGDYWILPSVENIFDQDVHYYDKNPFDNQPPYYMMKKYPDVGYYQIVYYRLTWDYPTRRYWYVPVAREKVYSVTDIKYSQIYPLYKYK